jgi:CRISPR system Cascade subunit CasE
VDWLRRKGAEGGFFIDEGTLRIFPRGRDYFEKNGQRGLHSAVEFQGALTVDNPTRFSGSFKRGIGPAKAFGFGLLVIEPIS